LGVIHGGYTLLNLSGSSFYTTFFLFHLSKFIILLKLIEQCSKIFEFFKQMIRSLIFVSCLSINSVEKD